MSTNKTIRTTVAAAAVALTLGTGIGSGASASPKSYVERRTTPVVKTANTELQPIVTGAKAALKPASRTAASNCEELLEGFCVVHSR